MCQCRKTLTLFGSFYSLNPLSNWTFLEYLQFLILCEWKSFFSLSWEHFFASIMVLKNEYLSYIFSKLKEVETPSIWFFFTPEYKCWRKIFLLTSKIFWLVLWTCVWLNSCKSFLNFFLIFFCKSKFELLHNWFISSRNSILNKIACPKTIWILRYKKLIRISLAV